MMEFKIVDKSALFERMAIDAVVVGLTFTELMVKLKHLDRSWVHG